MITIEPRNSQNYSVSMCVSIIIPKVIAVTGGQSAQCRSWAEVLWKNNSYKIFLDSTWLAWFAGGMKIEGPATGVLLRDESNILDHIKAMVWGSRLEKHNESCSRSFHSMMPVKTSFMSFLECHVRQKILVAHARSCLIYSRDDRKDPLSSEWLLLSLVHVSKDGDDAQKTKSDYLNQCNIILPAHGKTLLYYLSAHVWWMKL